MTARPFVAADRSRYRAEALAVATRIAAMQEERGMSTQELGRAAQVPGRRIQRLATAGCLRGPTTGEAWRIARALDVSPAWLAWGVE